jgi:hypothetical protein
MSKRYASFMLRWWRQGIRSELVEIECIQTGERLLFGSLADALAWIEADGSNASDSAPGAPMMLTALDAPGEAASAS